LRGQTAKLASKGTLRDDDPRKDYRVSLLYVEPVCPQEYQELCFKTPRFLQVGTRECFKSPSNRPNGQKIERTLVDVAVPQFAEDAAEVQDSLR